MAKFYTVTEVHRIYFNGYDELPDVSQLMIVVNESGKILFTAYESCFDGWAIVNFEEVKNCFNIDIHDGEISITENQYSDFQFEILDTDLSVEKIIAKISVEDFSEMEFSTISEEEFLKGTSLRNLDSEFDALITKCKQLKIDPRDLEQFIATKK